MNLLSIGGSDPSSGAGIQGDVRAVSALGAHCLGVVTAVTVQSTSAFEGAEPVTPRTVGAQLACVMSDFEISGIKIGMVYNSGIIRAVHRMARGARVPIVVDPVIESTTGGMLLEREALDEYRRLIVPLATVITPNQKEAAVLAGVRGPAAARAIREMGAKGVIITGIINGRKISDRVLYGGVSRTVPGERIGGPNRGSGGVHSAAVLFGLASGKTVMEAARFAAGVARASISDARGRGAGLPVTDPSPAARRLRKAINSIVGADGMARLIPQCQTNFVHSGPRPQDTGDVLGVEGRIVRAGERVIMAGAIRYGGSKHVASALIAAAGRFPRIRAAANIRYSEGIVAAARAAGMRVSHYDRAEEPRGEQSVPWGIGRAVSRARAPPDIIYHTGGPGKEPMVMVFGNTPESVAEKITTLIET